jgi:flagellar assembly factor FliW
LKRIATTRFGALDYEESDILLFPKGVPGFDDHHRWILAGDDDHPIKWLQSLDDGDVALPVIAPRLFFSDYHVNLPKGELDVLELDDDGDMALLAVVAVPAAVPMKATVNLRAPIVVNVKKHRARQVIALNEEYEVRHPLFQQAPAGEAT